MLINMFFLIPSPAGKRCDATHQQSTLGNLEQCWLLVKSSQGIAIS